MTHTNEIAKSENMMTRIVKDAAIYIGGIENAAADTNFKDSRTYAMLKDITDEISQATYKKLSDQELSALKDDAMQSSQNVDEKSNTIENEEESRQTLMANGMLNKAILLCKKQGVYPYYVTKLAAAALFYHAQIQNSEISNSILVNGLKTTIREICGFENEPELVYLISEAYKTIIAGEFFNIDRKRLEIVKSAFEVAFKNEAMYGGCPQCVIKSFLTIANKSDEKSKHMFKAASALSGGIACCNDSACGAYSGAVMVIGSYVGRELKDLDDENGETGAKGNDIGRIVHDKFIETYGTLTCKEIHKNIFGREFNFRYAGQLVEFREAGAHEDKCPMVVGIANSWVCGALFDEGLLA